VARFFYLIYAVLVDRKYPADDLEELLIDTYGRERAITDVSVATEIGTQVGVTLTNARDGSVYIATNYNGVGKRPQNVGESKDDPVPVADANLESTTAT
jgi:hypothetical protein